MENSYPIIWGASPPLVSSTTAFRNSTFTFPAASGRRIPPDEVSWRLPNLTSIYVESSLTTFEGDVEISLSSSISRMHNLRNFFTHSCLLMPAELSALEQLPNLEEVLIMSNSYSQGRTTNGSLPKLVSPNPFPRLTSLELQCSLTELCRYLSLANGISPGLRDLIIDVIARSKTCTFQNALVKIAEAFPLLENLTIVRSEDFSVFEEDVAGLVRQPLTYRNLQPLTRMRRLQSFDLQSEVVVSMTNSELCTVVPMPVAGIFGSQRRTHGSLVSRAHSQCPSIDRASLPSIEGACSIRRHGRRTIGNVVPVQIHEFEIDQFWDLSSTEQACRHENACAGPS